MIFLFSFLGKSEEINGIFARCFHDNLIEIEASGSSKQDINDTMVTTLPEYSVYPWEKKYDWCSNCGRSYDFHPWIIYNIKNRKMKFNKYYIRCGCCYNKCCCDDDYYGCFDCGLYSWSLHISDDKKTWTEIHRVDKDKEMRRCKANTYTLGKEYTTTYVRITQNDPCPGRPPCMSINRIDFFGSTIGEGGEDEDQQFVSYHDDDEDVSIIGHIARNADAK